MLLSRLNLLAQAQGDGGLSVGVLIITAFVIAVPLLITVVWLKADYSRHKRPLQEIDPNVNYTFWHHIRVVTIPLLSYRVSFYISKKDNNPPSNPQP